MNFITAGEVGLPPFCFYALIRFRNEAGFNKRNTSKEKKMFAESIYAKEKSRGNRKETLTFGDNYDKIGLFLFSRFELKGEKSMIQGEYIKHEIIVCSPRRPGL